MKILFLSQLLPLPLDAGPKIRAYYVLRHLAEAGHEVTLLCFVRPGDRESDVRELGRFCSTVETVTLSRSRLKDVRDGLLSLVSATPFLIRRDRSAAMDRRLEQVAGRTSFDAVHADQLWMAPYALSCRVPLKVLDQHNAVFKVPQRLAAQQRNPVVGAVLRGEATKLASFERSAVATFDRVVWVSEDDRRAFPSADRNRKGLHETIPIAIDPSERLPVERSRPFRVTFLGGLHWPPNAEGVRWFAERVWPKVAAAKPDALFTVIGKGGPGQLGSRNGRGGMTVVGYVADLERYLAETAAFIVPLHTGAGMRVKILDAWSWALPVVSTTVGAEGIRATAGEDLLVADTADAFADALIRVLGDQALARRLSRAGRSTVEALYDWRKVYRAWDRVYQ